MSSFVSNECFSDIGRVNKLFVYKVISYLRRDGFSFETSTINIQPDVGRT